MRKKSKKRNKMIGVALVIIVLLFGIITVKFIQYEKIIEDTERTWLITQYGPAQTPRRGRSPRRADRG